MASRDSSTRSAARATSSGLSGVPGAVGRSYRRVPTRWRLAGGSAALTFVILCGFAIIVGLLTTRQIRIQFDDSVRETADYLQARARVSFDLQTDTPNCGRLGDLASGEDSKVQVYYDTVGARICAYGGAHPLSPTFLPQGSFPREEKGYRVEVRIVNVDPIGKAAVIYARPLSALDRTAAKVRFFLILGVLGGSGLALLAGLMVARRAMAPIEKLTASAREIERTRDPGRHVPQPEADDEVAELARTLEDMLQALDSARAESEAALARQREFVADASHELRTPLTSVLANLELLAEQVEGEDAQAAVGSALRSSQRMRRLVADLLLLARHDRSPAVGSVPHRPVDLAQVLVDVAAELGPLAERGGHHLTVAAHEAHVVDGARDELHRLASNLIENALRHTPAGTHVHAALAGDDDVVVLSVDDDGPGIPDDLRPRLFERFVRGRGESGSGSGLGLAIVRAVAVAHGGSVAIERSAAGGARFVVRLPRAAALAPEPAPAA